MFIYFIQLVDLWAYGTVGLFLVFISARYLLHFIKLWKAGWWWSAYNAEETFYPPVKLEDYRVSVIIPVVDEPIGLWTRVLENLKNSLEKFHITHEVVVVANGGNGVKNAQIAESLGFEVLRLKEAGKRGAIKAAVEHLKSRNPAIELFAEKSITVILDSDTLVRDDSIPLLLRAFQFADVGGATPTHVVFDSHKNLMRVISSWLEDIRFREVLSGQSLGGAVSCLPGRLLAIRTSLLNGAVDELVNQTFLGNPCISGDDRFLTSWLLERGKLCVYVPESVVETNAPDTLVGFAKQRLRWSRTSLRETIRSLPWLFNYPYTALTVLSNVVMRWVFFVVILTGVLSILGFIHRVHYAQFSTLEIIVGTLVGFVISGTVLQLGHLMKNPRDIKYLIPFLFITTFILTPVEWFGNLTLKESGWMTRDLHGEEEKEHA